MVIVASQASVFANAQEEGHRHHVAVVGGAARHGSENSGFLGFDYVYRFDNDYAVAIFIEEVRGDFDIRAFGFSVGKYFSNGWKVATGPGMETKLKNDKNLFLWHVTSGYDWHRGSWSFGPVASYDFIEDASNTFYLGFAVGYSF